MGGQPEQQGRLEPGEADQHRSGGAVSGPLPATAQAGRSAADHPARRRALQQRRPLRPRVHHGQEGCRDRPVPRRQGDRQGGDQPAVRHVQALGHGREDEHPLPAEAPRPRGRPDEVRRRAADRRVHGRGRHAGLRGEEQRRGLQLRRVE